jgi:hypothetical protein
MVECTYVINQEISTFLRINLRHEIENKKNPKLKYAHPKHERHLQLAHVEIKPMYLGNVIGSNVSSL